MIYLITLIFHIRDIDFGKGLRKPFINMLIYLYEYGYDELVCNLVFLIPKFGYYKDLCNLYLIAKEK